MIQTRLQVYLPHFNKQHKRRLQRQIRLYKLQAAKYVKSHARKAKLRTIAAARRQYYPTHALADLRSAAYHNEDIFISSLLITFMLAFALAVTTANFTLQFMIAAVELAPVTGIDSMLTFVVAMAILSLAVAWLLAFITNVTALSVWEGATRKIYRSVRGTVRRSLAFTNRVVTSWALFCAGLGVPLLAATIGAIVWVQSHHISPEHAPYYILGASLTVFAWIIGYITSYSLVPYVSLFEPELSLTETFGRSRRLVVRRGRMFILGMYLSMIVILAVAFKLAYTLDALLGIPGGALFGLITFTTLLGWNGIMVMLYRKRRLARTR